MVAWIDAQSGVLGSVLLDPGLAPRLLADTSETDFSGAHRAIRQAVAALLAEGAPVDPVTVNAKLGSAYTQMLTDLLRDTPTAANYAAYVDAVKEQSRLAALRDLAGELSEAATLTDARSVLAKAQDVAADASNKRIFSMMQMLQDFYEAHQNTKKEYISWGIGALDDKVYADRGDVVVIGGYPSDGKSALMLQLAYHIAEKHRVGVFSFETSQAKITDRLVAHVMEIPFGKIKRSDLRLDDWHRITAGADAFTRRGVEIIEAAGMTVNDILGVTLAHGYEVIFIDYVQLISPERYRRGGTRSEEVAEISKALHIMAQRHNILVVELSQLSRPETTKKGVIPAPTLSRLRESGQLEQDADVVMLLYRTNPTAQNSPRELYVAKNKEGELGHFELEFDGKTQTFKRNTYREINRLAGKGLRETMEAAAEALTEPEEDNPFRQAELPM